MLARIPSIYLPGYEKARAIDPDMASKYVGHTMICDPQADAVIEQLNALKPDEGVRFIKAGMAQDYGALRTAPTVLRSFFESLESLPSWVDHSAFMPGIKAFHRNSKLVVVAFVAGTLVEGFTTSIAKPFFMTGRLRDQGVRRLKQNNRQILESFLPSGLDRQGDGWKLNVRVRLIHSQIRNLLKNSDEWDIPTWGMPISSAQLGFAIAAFSAKLLKHMESLGAVLTAKERQSFMAIWRYMGYLMGIPEAILFRDEEHALTIYEIGNMCEPPHSLESIATANALINSAPLVIGIDKSSLPSQDGERGVSCLARPYRRRNCRTIEIS